MRQRDTAHPRLFPELPQGATGYYSDPSSKWFACFVDKTLGEHCKATFHSFRHHFRDALMEADVSLPFVAALGGWKSPLRSAESKYGRGPSLRRLRDEIAKVKYSSLDLSHLSKQ
jgi:integrase